MEGCFSENRFRQFFFHNEIHNANSSIERISILSEINGRLWDVTNSLEAEYVDDKFKMLVTVKSRRKLNVSAFVQRSTDGHGLLQTKRNRKPYDDFDRNHK